MFASKEKKDKTSFHPAESISMISKTMIIHGDVEADHDMRIDGRITGNVYCKAKVVVGASGVIDGELHSENVDVFGTVNGNVVTKDILCLKSKAFINGNLFVGKLNIETDASFNGSCTMHQEKGVPAKKELASV